MGVQPFSWNPKDVARCLGREQLVAVTVREQTPQPRQVDVEDGVDGRGRGLAPKLLDQPIARNELVRVQKEKTKQRALLRAAKRKRSRPPYCLERPEDVEVETRLRTRRPIVRRQSLSGERFAAVYSAFAAR